MQSSHSAFQPPSPALEAKISELLARMSLEEKLLMLGGQPRRGATFPVARLGVPEFKMSDGPMGVHWWCSHATAYPALFCAAAAFDRELWFRLGRALGRDSRARGVHILLAPGVNLYRSPLCGRNFEYAGEDPYLAAQTAVGFIRGVQSEGVCATVKHFACNFQEYDRHHVSSDLDERTLHETYLPAFEAAVREAGVGAVMTAYNLVNGVHCSEHAYLIKNVLKGQWGFAGVVMSDWVSVYSDAAAANAGLDLEMPTAEWFAIDKLLPLIGNGTISESEVDDKVRRLLRVAMCFGWLEREQLDATIPHDDTTSKQVALEVARGGIVLLKNDDDVLPLNVTRLKRLAVLGPYAHPAVFSGGGSAYTTPSTSTSVLEGLRALVGDSVSLLHGTGPEPNPQRLVFANSHFQSKLGDGLVGEYFNNPTLSGDAVVTRLDPQLDFTWGPSAPMPEITVEHYSARWSGTFSAKTAGRHRFYSRSHDSVYSIEIDGTPIIDTLAGEQNGLHTVDLELEAGVVHHVEIVWKKTRYWGGMQFGYECIEHQGKEIDECVELARDSDAAVICVGFDNVSEGEGFDRSFSMNPQLEALVQAVARVQPNCVVVLTAGGNVDMEGWLDAVKGLLFVAYPGQEGGRAIAEILLGVTNPSGKLPATFERRLEDRSSAGSYHDDDHDKHVDLTDGIFTGYRHVDRAGIAPRFCFGHGLSYTRFGYEALTLDRERLTPNESLELSFDVSNLGVLSGSEIVQVYVHDVQSSVARPLKELKGFEKVTLAPGERRRVTIELWPRAFAFYDPDVHDFRVEPGTFEIWVGASSDDIRLRGIVEVT
ncbi:MAG: glycoside hydrolase family 3 C-terminal domain-containing protein [Polyangiaceae bacterium]